MAVAFNITVRRLLINWKLRTDKKLFLLFDGNGTSEQKLDAQCRRSLPAALARTPLANLVVHEDLFSFFNGLRRENKNFIFYGHKFSVAQCPHI
jgi:hypothetical protein